MCGTSANGQLSSEAARVKKVELWLYHYFCNCFVTFIFLVNECWHVILCKELENGTLVKFCVALI